MTVKTDAAPNDANAEEAVIGASLLSGAPIADIRAVVSPADFYRPANKASFAAVCSLEEQGKPTDPITVHAEQVRLGLGGLGIDELIAALADAPPRSMAQSHAAIVAAKARDRRAVALALELAKAARAGRLEAVLSRIVEHLAELGASASRNNAGDSWQERDLGAVIRGLLEGTVTRPEPTIGRRSDGVGLFYPARVNSLFGDSGDGKTYVAQGTACQEIAAGNPVLWMDYEDDEVGTVSRLLDLGAKPEDMLQFFHYFRPDEAFTPGAQEQIRRQVTELRPTLVVIDSAGESMSIDGTKPNDDDSVARWMRALPRFIANLGPCVVYIDHRSKSRDSGALFAIGSQRKRAAVSGAAYLVEMVREFGIGQMGRSKLTVAKDRCGAFVRGTKAAEFVLDATTTPCKARLEPPEPTSAIGTFMPTHLMERVSRWLELNPGASKNAVEKAGLGSKTEYVRKALEILVSEGHVKPERHGQSIRHTIIKPYREGDNGQDEEPF